MAYMVDKKERYSYRFDDFFYLTRFFSFCFDDFFIYSPYKLFASI